MIFFSFCELTFCANLSPLGSKCQLGIRHVNGLWEKIPIKDKEGKEQRKVERLQIDVCLVLDIHERKKKGDCIGRASDFNAIQESIGQALSEGRPLEET